MAQSDENLLKNRVPPQNNDAEVAVLSCCMDSKEALGGSAVVLEADDFYSPAHKLIFQVMKDLYAESKNVDMITVGEALKKHGDLEKAGGMAYLSEIVDAHALISNYTDYIRIVRQKSMNRKLITSINEIVQMSYEGDTDPHNLIELAIARLAELRDHGVDDETFTPLKQVLEQTVKNLITPQKEKAVMSHFSLLDWVTNGFRPGTLTIIAARPSMGKSAFVINIAANVAIKSGLPVAFFSLEMSGEEIANRILSSRCDISTSSLQSGKNLSHDELGRINGSLPFLGKAPLFIDEHSGTSPAEMLTRCRELQNKLGRKLGLICIDYLQLMSAVRPNPSRQQEISEISRSLKLMAKELKVPIIALSQLSRESEKRDTHRPILSDLRDSGAIEQDADIVMFVHRPDYYKNKAELTTEEDSESKKPVPVDEEKIEKAEIIVAKNRQGPTRTIYLSWNGSRTVFFESEHNDPDRPQGPSDLDAPPEFASQGIDIPDNLFAEPSYAIPENPAPAPAAPDLPSTPAHEPPVAAVPMPSEQDAPIPQDDPALFRGNGMEFESLDAMPWEAEGMDEDTYHDPGDAFGEENF